MSEKADVVGIVLDGDVRYPKLTLWGAEYNLPPLATRNIGGNQFVVIGIIPAPPPDFDIDAAIADLQDKPVADATPKALKGKKETDVAESEGTK